MEFLRLLKRVIKQASLIGTSVIAALVVFLLLFTDCSAIASSPSEEEIKAAFVYNFAKFIEWPEMSEKKLIKIGYVGDNPLSGNLALLSNRKIKELGIEVFQINDPEEALAVEVLFVPAADFNDSSEIIRAIADQPILSISDAPGFVKKGGVIGLKIAGNRLRFDVNLKLANRKGLKISSQLLSLAMEVIK